VAVTKHKSYTAAIASALTTDLNSLANGSASAASAALDNTSNLDLYHDLTLTVAAQGSARSAGATVSVYLVMALDGTNYDDANATTAELVAVFPLDAATTARQATRRDVPVPPGLFKYFVVNNTGQAFAASGNIVEYRAHSIETA
jgi:hypothetical protein